MSGSLNELAYKYLLETMLVIKSKVGLTWLWFFWFIVAKVFIISGENKWLLKIKSGELYFNMANVVAKEKFNPEQAQLAFIGMNL